MEDLPSGELQPWFLCLHWRICPRAEHTDDDDINIGTKFQVKFVLGDHISNMGENVYLLMINRYGNYRCHRSKLYSPYKMLDNYLYLIIQHDFWSVAMRGETVRAS